MEIKKPGTGKPKKVAKLAHEQKAKAAALPKCECGGDRVWAQVVRSRPRMERVCMKCGKAEA